MIILIVWNREIISFDFTEKSLYHKTLLLFSGKNRMNTGEVMLTLKAIKSHSKGLYDKQILTLVDILLYEIYETRRRLDS